MGRKIPAKKHRGIKDPIKQGEQRFAKIKSKINEAPTDLETQEIPKKLKNLFKKPKKRKMTAADIPFNQTQSNPALKAKPANEFQPQRPLKKIPKIERRPGESDRQLLWRAELTTRNYLQKSKFEDKYDVDVETDDHTGEVKMKKRNWDAMLDDGKKEIPETKWERKKLRKMEKKKEEIAEKKKIRKEKFKNRKMKKKNRGKAEQDEFSSRIKQDKVEFGEVAAQPPTLTAKPRKSLLLDKPGTRNLLLKGLIPNNQPSTNLSGKRKDLSALDRQRLEEERQRAVDLYREMQKLKHANRAGME